MNMNNLSFPNPQFGLDQRVTTIDGESGIVYGIFYTRRSNGSFWRLPGFTYFVQFDTNSDTPRSFDDTAHESELEAQ
jgi:hypothetical protein